jgi:pilus assembly protein Flp/PilA
MFSLARQVLKKTGRKGSAIHSHGRKTMRNLLSRLWREEEGQDLVEYALLLVLIALVAIAAITTVGKAVSNVFSNAATNLTST